MALTYLKGLTTELEKGDLLVKQSSDEDSGLEPTLMEVNSAILKLQSHSKKLEDSIEKLYEAFDKLTTEEKEKLVSIDDEKCEDLLNATLNTVCDLQALENSLRDRQSSSDEKREEKMDELLKIQTDLMQKLVETRQVSDTGPNPTQRNTTNNAPRNVKLPKLEFPTYSGDPLGFKEFWDQFEVSVHDHSGLSAVEKFTYLKNGLSGVAKETISGLSLTNENYPVAVLLWDRFGDNQSVINAHYVKLMEIPAANNVTDLRVMYNKIEAHLTLEAITKLHSCPRRS